MPNHCTNNLTIQGDRDEIVRFWNDVQSIDDEGKPMVRLVSLLPMPDALEGTESPTPTSPEPHPNWINLLNNGEITQKWHDELVSNNIQRYENGQKAYKETGYHNWYEWADQKWGTKWGDYDTYLTSDALEDTLSSGEIQIVYTTAWCPLSESFYETISSKYPTLVFRISYTEEGANFVGHMVVCDGDVLYAECVEPEVVPYDKNEDMDEYYEKHDEAVTEALDRLIEDGEKVI